MNPFVDLGFIIVRSYHFGLILGFVLSTILVFSLASLSCLDKLEIFRILGILLFFGIVGARLLFLIKYSIFFKRIPEKSVIMSAGGSAQYGALILGIIAFFLYCRYRKLNAAAFGDVFAPAAMLMVIFARIGCFLNGCCFGKACSQNLGVAYPKGSLPYSVHLAQGLVTDLNTKSLPVYPTQILNAFFALICLIVLLLFFFQGKYKGKLLWLMLLLYAPSRFINGFFRYDEQRVFGLTYTQILSIPLTFFAIYMWKTKSSKS